MEHSLKVIDILLFPRGGTRAWREAWLVVQVYVVGVRETGAPSGMLLQIGAQAVVRRVHPRRKGSTFIGAAVLFVKPVSPLDKGTPGFDIRKASG